LSQAQARLHKRHVQAAPPLRQSVRPFASSFKPSLLVLHRPSPSAVPARSLPPVVIPVIQSSSAATRQVCARSAVPTAQP
jgi:hypothetical protein